MEWGAACAGEVGEGINKAKKIRRLHNSEQYSQMLPMADALKSDVADEIADVVIYADLWAARMGVDLGEAVRSKFDRTSDKVQSNVKLGAIQRADNGDEAELIRQARQRQSIPDELWRLLADWRDRAQHVARLAVDPTICPNESDAKAYSLRAAMLHGCADEIEDAIQRAEGGDE